jgi:hypothetical protein
MILFGAFISIGRTQRVVLHPVIVSTGWSGSRVTTIH